LSSEQDDSGSPQQLPMNEHGQVWDGGPRDLGRLLSRYYGHRVRLQGDWYHESNDEYLYDVLVYCDGDKNHLVKKDVSVFGHGPSGAAGVEADALPSKERVQQVVDAVGGDGDD